MTATALIIDDEPDIRELIALTLSRMGLEHHSAANIEEARNLLQVYEFDLCLTDMRLPDGNGVDFVRFIHSAHPNLPVAVITAHGNMEAAVEAMKNGAFDFVSKPVDLHLLRGLVARAVALNTAEENSHRTQSTGNDVGKLSLGTAANQTDHASNAVEVSQTSADNEPNEPSENVSLNSLSGRTDNQTVSAVTNTISDSSLVGTSAPMQALRQMIAKVAKTNAPVWITGESGTGKELIARLIHENGPRGSHPFVAINCGAIPTELMESELFGHVKGSFTGASSDKEGLFQRAQSGTIFLDEVAELPLHMQVKLLRAIQERSIRPVGSNDEITIDARILSASHKDLNTEVEAGRFRHDLYYRLNVISIVSPSLRNRSDDIPALCEFILNKHLQTNSTQQAITIHQKAIEKLSAYSFPGNVRELENLLERAVALCDSHEIKPNDLALSTTALSTNNDTKEKQAHKSNERDLLVEALHATRWNRKAAASKLGLTYRQLRYRIKQLGIDGDTEK